MNGANGKPRYHAIGTDSVEEIERAHLYTTLALAQKHMEKMWTGDVHYRTYETMAIIEVRVEVVNQIVSKQK
jgi:hypothetical protein